MSKLFIRFALLIATLPCVTLAADTGLTVNGAYVLLTSPGARVSAAFMSIGNPGSEARKLVRAECPAAKAVELHAHVIENGLVKVRKVEHIDVPAQGQVDLKSGGFYLMLIDLKTDHKEGDPVVITLTFDDGSRKQIAAPLRREAVAGDVAAGQSGTRH